uniref:Ribosomal protein L5 C-terminal domain-containing protein n=1 Tax=Felis catus TaxID=9685 RepID=A0ABI7ZES6_FELCA
VIARVTNRDIVCQMAYAHAEGDMLVCAAHAHELPKYGVKAGLTGYTAAYCVHLPLAGRLLTRFGTDKTYEGQVEGTGDEYNVNGTDGQAGPFTCYWDVGLARTAPADKVLELWVEACWSLTAPNDPPPPPSRLEKRGVQCRRTSEARHGSERCRLCVWPHGRRRSCFQKQFPQCTKNRGLQTRRGRRTRKSHRCTREGYEKKPKKEVKKMRWSHPKIPPAPKNDRVIQKYPGFLTPPSRLLRADKPSRNSL